MAFQVKQLMLHLKEEIKVFMDKVRQTESRPNQQEQLATQHMRKFGLTLQPTLLTIEDVEEAENELIRVSRQQTYPEEIIAL